MRTAVLTIKKEQTVVSHLLQAWKKVWLYHLCGKKPGRERG